ncbi:MAG: hypothetical protein AAF081_08870 [Actinomycetota bacterium]
MTPGEVVRAFFERMEARDWGGSGELRAEDLIIDVAETGERFEVAASSP